MSDAGAFYGALAAVGATVYGLGFAFTAARIVSLIERVTALDRERGDLVDRKTFAQGTERTQLEWEFRSRRDALADLHPIIGDLRSALTSPLIGALLYPIAALVPLMGWPPDRIATRLVLLLAFPIAAIPWARALLRLIDGMRAITRRSFDELRKEQKASTAKGHPYIVSGDPDAMAEGLERLLPEIAETRPGRRYLKRMRQPPRGVG